LQQPFSISLLLENVGLKGGTHEAVDILSFLIKFLVSSLVFHHDDFVNVFVLAHVSFLFVDHLLSLLQFEFGILVGKLFFPQLLRCVFELMSKIPLTLLVLTSYFRYFRV
jgi:hypothetical protein